MPDARDFIRSLRPPGGFIAGGMVAVIGGIVLVAAVWAVTLERVGYERESAVQETVKHNSNMALAFEQHVARTFQALDSALRFITYQYLEQGRALDLRRMFESGVVDPGLLAYAGIVDSGGRLVVSSNNIGHANLADTEFFLFHRTHAGNGLRIGRPTAGRPAGELAIHFTRRIEGDDGRFLGVALIAVAPARLADFFRQIDVGARGVLQLVSLDGVGLARRVGTDVSFGRDMTGSSLLAHAGRAPTGNYVTRGTLDQIVTFMSYRVLRDYPVVVAAGTAVDDSLARFHARQRNYYASAATASLLIAAAVAMLLLALAQRRRAMERERRDQARYRATFDQSAIGIAHARLDGGFIRANPKFCGMLGYAEEELLRLDARDVTHPTDLRFSDSLLASLVSGAAGSSLPEVEKRYLRKDGGAFWATVTLSLVRDAGGRPDYLVAMVQDITARKVAQERVAHQAHYDGLTDLPNRELCYDRLAQALIQAERKQWTAGVLFVDLDRFKTLNDTLGHAVGDGLLLEAARRLARCVRAGDTVARVGGDEFALILTELASAQDAALVAQKVIDAMAAPLKIEGREVFVTASIGIATYPADGREGEALMKNADAAMFQAKQHGRNNFQFYTAAMNERAMEMLLLENDLRRALERNEFVLYFQPKISLASARLTGLEALIRWNRAGNGLVSPAQFVPVLEDSGLIVPVGDWVIGAACRQIRAWQDAGLQVVPVAVNLAMKQFLHRDMAHVIDEQLRYHGVDPRCLEVEITESDAMQNPTEVVAMLGRLRERKIGVSIDDFGTGYSSLGYLKRLPVDALKLDRSFVSGLPSDRDDASIARAVIGMAHSLGLKVIAEGVETQEQREFLAASGCDQMQGYLFSRPLPAEECAAFLFRGDMIASAA